MRAALGGRFSRERWGEGILSKVLGANSILLKMIADNRMKLDTSY
jgi:hypothetical protein